MRSSTLVLTLFLLVARANAHFAPAKCRGQCKRTNLNPLGTDFGKGCANHDYRNHFPSGKKEGPSSETGRPSQVKAAGPKGWTPFEPEKSSFIWRAGVCGDEKGKKPQDHLKGGKFYNNGFIMDSYTEGGETSVTFYVAVAHQGYISCSLCDGREEISEKSFRTGKCKKMLRVKDPKCESRMSKDCAPIDEEHPDRWYMPCEKDNYPNSNVMVYDGIRLKVPDGMSGPHMIRHCYAVTSNFCLPPGMLRFFNSNRAPLKWGNCPGQNRQVGGIRRDMNECGGTLFPEEYYSCTDVEVKPKPGGKPGTDAPTTTVTMTAEANTKTERTTEATTEARKTPKPENVQNKSQSPPGTPRVSPAGSPVGQYPPPPPLEGDPSKVTARDGVISDMVLVADGKKVRSVKDKDVVDISQYQKIALECVTSMVVDGVMFELNGKELRTDFYPPYFMHGNIGQLPNYWSKPIVNRWFTVTTKAGGNVDEMRLYFVEE